VRPGGVGSLQIDEQLEFCWLLDWQVAGLFSESNTIDVSRSFPINILYVYSIPHQGTRLGIFALSGNKEKNRRQRHSAYLGPANACLMGSGQQNGRRPDVCRELEQGQAVDFRVSIAP